MNNIGKSLFDIGRMDTLAAGDSPVHRIDPGVKLITTLAFIITVVSFQKYALWSLLPFLIFPVSLISAGGLPARDIFRRVAIVLPFAVLIGILNPFVDHKTVFYLGHAGISGGWVSFVSILLRFVLTASAALVLIASTGINSICDALAGFGVPRPFTTQLLLFYRYIFILTDETDRMIRAWQLRSFGSRRVGLGVFISLSGNLLLRALDRADRAYRAMLCRGFDGRIPMIRHRGAGPADLVFLAVWTFLFVVFRFCDIPLVLGRIVTGLF